MFIAVANTSGQATWSTQFVNISSAQNTLFQSKFFNKYHQMMFYEIVTNHFESAVLSQGFKLKKGNMYFFPKIPDTGCDYFRVRNHSNFK